MECFEGFGKKLNLQSDPFGIVAMHFLFGMFNVRGEILRRKLEDAKAIPHNCNDHHKQCTAVLVDTNTVIQVT